MALQFCAGEGANRSRPRAARAAADVSPPPPPERRKKARDGGVSQNHALPVIHGGLLVKESGPFGQKSVCTVQRCVFRAPNFLVSREVSWAPSLRLGVDFFFCGCAVQTQRAPLVRPSSLPPLLTSSTVAFTFRATRLSRPHYWCARCVCRVPSRALVVAPLSSARRR